MIRTLSPSWAVMILFGILAVGVLPARAQVGQLPNSKSIINSRHNLSVSGPGKVKATSEQEICIFCHAPHNASPVQPLWNRSTPTSAYTVYTSPSLQKLGVNIGQPSGSSKLCLSCHDGTIALGSVLSRGQPITMAAGATTLPPGASNLGTDLSDDHPISFRYDTAAAADPNLVPIGNLPPNVKLDYELNMQCTSCHDAHDNSFGNFLVMDNTNSQLCNSCHRPGQTYTDIAGHDQCASCHQQHTAPSKAYLLLGATVTDTCLVCHGATTTAPVSSANVPMSAMNVTTKARPRANRTTSNIFSDLRKISRHDTTTLDVKNRSTQQVTCSDCHESHSIRSTQGTGGSRVRASLGKINGVNNSGAKITRARFEYEICYKCHAEKNSVPPVVNRQIVEVNTRLQFAPSAVSYHPVEAQGKNTFVPSLRPGMNTATVITCTDCHNSDTGKKAGGSGPDGPHGSNFPPLLIARYETLDNTPESQSAYALCYSCHDRSSILSNRSFTAHRQHIVDHQTPCSVCHDTHGISSNKGISLRNSHLINFDTTVARPDPTTHKLEYKATGIAHGNCTLLCHNSAHNNRPY